MPDPETIGSAGVNAILSPSLLSADLANPGMELEKLEQAGIRWVHLDVMDGQFAPNITFGAPVISALRKRSSLFFDAHLMIERPEQRFEDFRNAGVDLLVPHLEALAHPQKALTEIRKLGMKAGIALNPGSDFSGIRWLLSDLDMILIMGVNPGFSGQKFIPETVEKIKSLREFLARRGKPYIPIQMDGGASPGNAAELLKAGANILVSGSAFFRHPDYAESKKLFTDVAREATLSAATEKSLQIARCWQSRGNTL